jgi:hypothetical protein
VLTDETDQLAAHSRRIAQFEVRVDPLLADRVVILSAGAGRRVRRG